MKKISVIGIVGLPPCYGGFETFVDVLVRNLSKEFIFTVFCSSKIYQKKIDTYNGAYLEYLRFKPNGIQSVLYDSLAAMKSIKTHDILLFLGVSGSIILPFLRKKGAKIVINIDGIEWKRKKWNYAVRLYLRLSELMAVRSADIIIVDNMAIKQYLDSTYNINAVYIPYGADHVKKLILSKETTYRYPFLNEKPYALNVARFEPENNIDLILEAFKELNMYNLILIGGWNKSKYGKNLKRKYEKYKNIYFLGGIYDQVVLNEIRSNAYVYIHGHSVGGTNPALIEAMYLGLPIIAYKCTFNISTTKGKSKYFLNKEELISIINNLNTEMLMKMREESMIIARKEYVWEKVLDRYKAIFNEI